MEINSLFLTLVLVQLELWAPVLSLAGLAVPPSMYEDSTAINMNSDPANRNSRPSATLALEVKTNKTGTCFVELYFLFYVRTSATCEHVIYSIFILFNVDPSSTVSKQANRNGKKRENGNAQWNVAAGGTPMLGPVSSGSKNQKLWQPKPRNLDKRQRGQQGRGAQCGTGNGTQRKNDYQVFLSFYERSDIPLTSNVKFVGNGFNRP